MFINLPHKIERILWTLQINRIHIFCMQGFLTTHTNLLIASNIVTKAAVCIVKHQILYQKQKNRINIESH